jgi:hypothetical protein
MWYFAGARRSIVGAGFLKWKANHHDDQPGSAEECPRRVKKVPYSSRNSSTKSWETHL